MKKLLGSIAFAAAALVLALARPSGAEASCRTCEQGVTECMVCTLGCSDSGMCGTTCNTGGSCGSCTVGECGGSSECSCTLTFENLMSAAAVDRASDEVSTLRFASADGRNVSRRLCDASITERDYTEDAVNELARETRQIAL